MKLEQDKIVIESRREIDALQDMIELYLKKDDVKGVSKEELKSIVKRLDVLYMSW